ncbi:hypothetical protein AB6A40_006097 [Gnathostoma spinigerum]|uniref:Uncharacterized protein n=1 Tax=Gnathostoma spinigerum TaxID=75299 RepID=A0ABD6EHE4_9BILA
MSMRSSRVPGGPMRPGFRPMFPMGRKEAPYPLGPRFPPHMRGRIPPPALSPPQKFGFFNQTLPSISAGHINSEKRAYLGLKPPSVLREDGGRDGQGSTGLLPVPGANGIMRSLINPDGGSSNAAIRVPVSSAPIMNGPPNLPINGDGVIRQGQGDLRLNNMNSLQMGAAVNGPPGSRLESQRVEDVKGPFNGPMNCVPRKESSEKDQSPRSDVSSKNEMFAKEMWKKLDSITDADRLSRLQTELMNLVQQAVADEERIKKKGH